MSKPIRMHVRGPKKGKPADHYQFFWSMYVRGFDYLEHCQACLVGDRGRQIYANKAQFNRPYTMNEALLFDYLYICGFSWKGYQHNLHAPVQHAPGESCIVQSSFDHVVEFENAKLLAIPDVPLGYANFTRDFTTCRNWRFGLHYYRPEGLPKLPLVGK